MELLRIILLFLIKKMNGSRTVFGIYHILTGKKTAQTIQDCRLFNVSQLFGVYKQLERPEVIKIIHLLVEKHYIKSSGENRFILTANGESFLRDKLSEQGLPVHLNGFLYKDVADVFWMRLALLVQCLSYLKANQFEFVPVSKDGKTQRWVKEKLRSSRNSPSDLANKLYFELETILQQFSSHESAIFVLRLSSFHRVGFTLDQVARELSITLSDAQILFTNIIHGMITKVLESNNQFPTLCSLLDNIDFTNPLTETAQKTYNLLQKGLDIEAISNVRELKINTIEDHIVEIALNCDDFSIDSFVAKKTQQAIMNAIQRLKTKKLKEIKGELDEEISYFEIRLTLAKKGF